MGNVIKLRLPIATKLNEMSIMGKYFFTVTEYFFLTFNHRTISNANYLRLPPYWRKPYQLNIMKLHSLI